MGLFIRLRVQKIAASWLLLLFHVCAHLSLFTTVTYSPRMLFSDSRASNLRVVFTLWPLSQLLRLCALNKAPNGPHTYRVVRMNSQLPVCIFPVSTLACPPTPMSLSTKTGRCIQGRSHKGQLKSDWPAHLSLIDSKHVIS